MSDQTAQEPTMEEILASIRRIISEDDAPSTGLKAPSSDDGAEGASADAGFELPDLNDEPAAPEDDVLELTERVETHGDIEAYIPDPEPEVQPALPPLDPEPEPEIAQAPPPQPTDTIVSAATASAAAAAFGQLSSNILMPPSALTLDEVVRQLLRPLLKDWLDTHLQDIVQTAVTEEVERIARGRR